MKVLHVFLLSALLKVGLPHNIYSTQAQVQAKAQYDLANAVLSNNVQKIQESLDKGASIDSATYYMITLLHTAASIGNKNVAIVLLNNGADVYAMNHDGDTPLHIAASCGHLDFVTVLLNFGAIVNITNSNANTPLDLAEQNGHNEIVEFLLRHQRAGNN